MNTKAASFVLCVLALAVVPLASSASSCGQLDGDRGHVGRAQRHDRDDSREWARSRRRWSRLDQHRAVRPVHGHLAPGGRAEPAALVARSRPPPRRAGARHGWRRVYADRRAVRPGREPLDADGQHERRPVRLHRHAAPRRARARRRRPLGQRHRRAGERRAVRPGDRALDLRGKPADPSPKPHRNAARRRDCPCRGRFQLGRLAPKRRALRPRPRALVAWRTDDDPARARERDAARERPRAGRRRRKPERNAFRRALRPGLRQVGPDGAT